jgi:hypothetical protein
MFLHGPVEPAGAGRHPPESVRTDATVTPRLVAGAPTITRIDLVIVGRVPGVDDAAFAEYAATAKATCPVSRALAGVPEVSLTASLASQAVWPAVSRRGRRGRRDACAGSAAGRAPSGRLDVPEGSYTSLGPARNGTSGAGEASVTHLRVPLASRPASSLT